MGHRGIVNTFHAIRQKYFWHNMYNDCNHYVKSCTTCMRNKHTNKNDRSPLNPIEVSNKPFAHWFCDLIGPLKTTKHGYSYIFTCVDSFSKLVEVVPLRDITALTVAKTLFDHIICRYGCFEVISTDRGTQYTSVLFKHLAAMCNSKHILAASGHHAGVGQVERENQTIERMLTKYVNFERNNWDESLNLVRYAINTSINDATGVSPYLLTFGREPKLPLDIALRKPDNLLNNVETELEDLIAKVTFLDKIVKDNIDHNKTKMKEYYDKHSKEVNYKVGQLVWLYLFQLPKHMAGKLQTHWHGPYRIIAKEKFNYKLKRVEDGTIIPVAVHPDRLQPYFDRQISPPIPLTPPKYSNDQTESCLNESVLGANPVGEPAGEPEANSDMDQSVAQSIPNTVTAHQSVHTNFSTAILPIADQLHMDANSDDKHITQSQLPHPDVTDHMQERLVHSIPKARKTNNVTEYYIIYDDQVNKEVGQYISENELTATERAFIEQNKDNIRFMRRAPKPNSQNI